MDQENDRKVDWYPAHAESAALEKEWRRFERESVQSKEFDEVYDRLSKLIESLSVVFQGQPYLVRDWVWIASQARIVWHSNADLKAQIWAGASIVESVLDAENCDRPAQQKIHWATDRTVQKIYEEKGPASLRQYVSSSEAKRIEDLLLELANNDKETDLDADGARRIAKEIFSIHNEAFYPAISAKLEEIIRVAQRSQEEEEESVWARAAVKYLRKERDIIKDSYGYLGFVDDIHVIEQVYSLLFGDSSWARLRKISVGHWPSIDRIYWDDGGQVNYLPRYLKSVVSCGLLQFNSDSDPKILVLPDTGPAGFLIACLMTLEGGGGDSKEGDLFEAGEDLLFRDGRRAKYVTFYGSLIAPDGRKLPAVRLRNDCVETVNLQVLGLLERANRDGKRLATSAEFARWQQRVIQQTNLPVQTFHRGVGRQPVLLITERNRFEQYRRSLRPFGRYIEELIPILYQTKGGRTKVGSGAANAVPALVICSDFDTADDLLRHGIADAGGKRCHWKCVIVDRQADELRWQILLNQSRGGERNIPLVGLTPIRDWEKVENIGSEWSVWFVDPSQVMEVPKRLQSAAAMQNSTGILGGYSNRLVRSQDIQRSLITVKCPPVDYLAEQIDQIARGAFQRNDEDLKLVAVMAHSILRAISKKGASASWLDDSILRGRLYRLQKQCGQLAIFDASVEKLFEYTTQMIRCIDNLRNPKNDVVMDLLETAPGFVSVITPGGSESGIEKYFGVKIDPLKGRLVPATSLEEASASEAVIVPGWYGKRAMQAMQHRICSNEEISVLFEFEARRAKWLDKHTKQVKQTLMECTAQSWLSCQKNLPEIGSPPEVSIEDPQIQDEDKELVQEDEPVFDEILIEVIQKAIDSDGQGSHKGTFRKDVTARLVLFEDEGYFGLFAPGAKLICLNEVMAGPLDYEVLSDAQIRNLLWKEVRRISAGDVLAFPDHSMFEDIIEELAEYILGDSGATRRRAATWIEIVRNLVEEHEWDFEAVSMFLREFGVAREPVTIAGWVHSRSTIAPSGRTETIPRIFECAGLPRNGPEVRECLKAVQKIYRARRAAAKKLISKLPTARIDGNIAELDVEGHVLRYLILVVRDVGKEIDVPMSATGLQEVGLLSSVEKWNG